MTMTRRILHDLGCACGRHFRRALYHAIDVQQQPGLRYAVLGGVLNTVQCPACEVNSRVDVPFLYSDTGAGRLFYVCPAGSEEQECAIREQVAELMRVEPAKADRPELLFGIERLTNMIGEELGPDEQPAAVSFDVRPGIRPERAARILAARVAQQVGGYVHTWREGGRLHVQILGPREHLEAMTIAASGPSGD